jgi:hypothetical protein
MTLRYPRDEAKNTGQRDQGSLKPPKGCRHSAKSILEGAKLDPLGWEIVLEVVVKTKSRVREVPIIFSDRQEGKSKLGFKAQIDYLCHLVRLYAHRCPLSWPVSSALQRQPFSTSLAAGMWPLQAETEKKLKQKW